MLGAIDIFITILCYFGYAFATITFCRKYLEVSQTNERLFYIFLFCSKAFLYGISKYNFVASIFFSLLSHLIFIGFIAFLFRGSIEKKVLTASILIVITTLAANFFQSFLSALALFWMHVAKKISDPILGEWEANLIYWISCVMAILAIRFISKHFLSVFYGMTRKWHVALAVPLLAITLVIDVANWGASHGILVRSGGDMGLYYDQIFSHCEFCILTVLSMFATGFYVFGMNRIYIEQKKSSQYHEQIAAYQMLEEQYRMQERLRHDLKNHLIALYGLLENQELEKMKNYLKNMENTADLGGDEDLTGNRIVDVLLHQKRKLAERNDTIWECDVQMPNPCSISDFDLCVLFGNILDNAVEACEKQANHSSHPWIHIRARAVKKCFLLEVKNSMNETHIRKGKLSDNKTEGHGIGLLNINDVIGKYNGVMNIEMEENAFVISLLIPLSGAAHDMEQVI